MAVDARTLDTDDAAAFGAARDTRKPESSSVVQDPHRTVDAEHPWLGLASFTEETRTYFFGREQEVAELGRRVQRKLLTILFGQSGLGKTSILRAGIVPKLRPAGYCPVYVRIDYSNESPPPADQIKEAIFRATQAHGQWTQAGIAVEGESLWEFLHHRDDVLKDSHGKTVVPLLIFDQFEEIFTLAQADDEGRRRAAQFIEDLADLVENRPPKALEAKLDSDDSLPERFDFARADYRILIALREDYLAHLEGVKGAMPSITQNRMRLAPMTGQQALSAVIKPGGKLVSEEVAESIVRFIAGGSEIPNAEVEPSLLSLICRELNNARIAQGRSEISVDLLAGSNETILAEFYERALADQPPAVRRFIEDEMLTDSGYRESLAEERIRKAFNAAGATADALARLVDRRLLRIEERLDLRRVELTHDVLCNVVAASRDLRHEREARDEAERQLEAQRAREVATRKALLRARKVAAGCALLAVAALGSAIFGYESMKRAQQAEAKALQTRTMAESARGEAEKLIVFLLDDFYLELEPIGRLDIVGDLAKRALDYYAALPAELRTAETDRNRALAQVRYGYVLRYQAKLAEGEKVLMEAISVLQRLRREGDRSEITAIGLGLGLSAMARVRDSMSRDPEAVRLAAEASEVLGPLMKGEPTARLRRAYGGVMNYLGFAQRRHGREEEAIKSLEAAREAYRSVDELKLGDLASAAGYAEASAWMVHALSDSGRAEDARRIGAEAVTVAGAILEQRPGHMAALRSRALILSALGWIEHHEFRQRKSVAYANETERDWATLVRLDPGNNISWNNLGVTRLQQAFALEHLGRSSESAQKYRGILDIIRRRPNLATNFVVPVGFLARLEADLGINEPPLYHQVAAQALQHVSRDSFQGRFYTENVAHFDRQIAFIKGNYKEARESAQAATRRMGTLKTASIDEVRGRDRGLADINFDAAWASYNLGDHSAAEREARQSVRHWQALPMQIRYDKTRSSQARILLAMALARQGKNTEARALAESEVKHHRGLRSAGSDDVNQHLLLARAQYAAALASPGDARASLTEAAAIVDGLPKDMSRRKTIVQFRGWIADETAKLR